MHPDDVADLVEVAVANLHAVAAHNTELPITAIELRAPTQLYVRYEAELSESAVAQHGMTLYDVPIFGSAQVITRYLHLDLTDWDGIPPRILLYDENGAPVAPEAWPKDPNHGGIVMGHPLYGPGPFFCRPGTREFHSHPQHEDEPWDRFRSTMPLAQIVVELVRDLTDRWILR